MGPRKTAGILPSGRPSVVSSCTACQLITLHDEMGPFVVYYVPSLVGILEDHWMRCTSASTGRRCLRPSLVSLGSLSSPSSSVWVSNARLIIPMYRADLPSLGGLFGCLWACFGATAAALHSIYSHLARHQSHCIEQGITSRNVESTLCGWVGCICTVSFGDA